MQSMNAQRWWFVLVVIILGTNLVLIRRDKKESKGVLQTLALVLYKQRSVVHVHT